MVLKAEQERVHALLKDTITLLCKNGLSFKSEFSVEALIGITLDKSDVFLININEIIKSEVTPQKSGKFEENEDMCSEEDAGDQSSGGSGEENASGDEQPSKKKRRKRRRRIVKAEAQNSTEEEPDGTSNAQKQQTEDGQNYQETENKSQPAEEKKVVMIKRDKEDNGTDDIIIIKEETNEEDWSHFGDVSAFPSGSGADLSESATTEQSFMSASASFMSASVPAQAAGSSFDWSQGTQNQIQLTTGTPMSDSNQQNLGADLPCGICGKVLRKRSSLFVHLKLHEGKYNYNCPTCHKGFTSKSMLQGHMSWHTGVKEFKCVVCEKEFRYPQDLRRHMVKMHAEDNGSENLS